MAKKSIQDKQGNKILGFPMDSLSNAPGMVGRHPDQGRSAKGTRGASDSKSPHKGKYHGAMLGEPNVERAKRGHKNVQNPKTHGHKLKHE